MITANEARIMSGSKKNSDGYDEGKIIAERSMELDPESCKDSVNYYYQVNGVGDGWKNYLKGCGNTIKRLVEEQGFRCS